MCSVEKEEKLKSTISRRAWSIWFVATLFVALQLFISILFGISTKELSSTLSISEASVGNIAAVFALSYACMQIPAGFILDRVSIKWTLFIVALLTVIGLFILGTTHSVFIAYFAALLMGIATSFTFVAAALLIGRWFNPNRFSIILGACSGTNGLLAALAVYPVLLISPAVHANYIVLTAVLGIIITVLILVVIRDYPKGTKQTDTEHNPVSIFTEIYKSVCNSQILLASVITALGFGSMISFMTFWNIQYQALYGLDLKTISLLNIIALIGVAIGAPTLGMLSEKVGKRKPVGMGICVCLFFCLAVLLQPVKLPLPVVFITMFCIGFFANNVAISFALVKENSEPQFIGTAISVANTILFLGVSLFNFLPGGISNYLHSFKQISIHTHITRDISYMSTALYIYPLAAIITFILFFFIKETHCKSRIDIKE